MFTGIVRHVGKVLAATSTPAGKRLTLDVGPLATGLSLGDSVAVSGACLTACDIQGSRAAFDVIRETLDRTTLGGLAVGGRANLERALQLSSALDGHLVQGHVDGIARVAAIRRSQGEYRIEFHADSDLLMQMVPKGSVAVDGVSLTLAAVEKDRFSVALIPTTLGETTLADLRPGDKVNIETDVIGKYVLKYLKQLAASQSGKITLEKLRETGIL